MSCPGRPLPAVSQGRFCHPPYECRVWALGDMCMWRPSPPPQHQDLDLHDSQGHRAFLRGSGLRPPHTGSPIRTALHQSHWRAPKGAGSLSERCTLTTAHMARRAVGQALVDRARRVFLVRGCWKKRRAATVCKAPPCTVIFNSLAS